MERRFKDDSAKDVFYPRKRKLKPIPFSIELVNANVQPAVYRLNRGGTIVRGSEEHKLLLELLEKANQ